MVDGYAPPGWPSGVPGPGAPGWEHAAAEWLLDHAPASWRTNPRWKRYPLALAWVTCRHLDAQVAASRQAWQALGDAQPELGDPGIMVVRQTLASTGPTLVADARSAELLCQALQGGRFIPRL